MRAGVPSHESRGIGARILATILTVSSAISCSEGSRSEGGATWQAVRDTVGDTVVVRTESGSVWGEDAHLVEEVRIGRLEGPEEYTFGRVIGLAVAPDGAIYVVDGQGPALRKYAADGSYLFTLGGKGKGPGEYANTDGGVAVLPDGRVLLRDPGNARITVYSPEGDYLDAWRISGGMFTNSPLIVDTVGRSYHMDFEFEKADVIFRFVRFATDGTVLDTLPYPDRGYEAPQLTAVFERGDSRSMSMAEVPFAPVEYWALSPLGYFVGGVTDRYAVNLLRPEGALRIERRVEPVAVRPEEKADARRRTIAQMRGTDPKWDWDGPAIPEEKPAYKTVFAGLDGRIWILRSTPGERIPVEELDEEEDRPGQVPAARWREPIAFDVFEPDGTYLGVVRAPERFQMNPQPLTRGDHVWATVSDEFDVPYVVRYRIAYTAAPKRS